MIINQTVAGGMKINGIIEEYTVMAGKNVSAGDFVEYVCGMSDDQKLSTNSYSGSFISAEQIDDHHALVVFSPWTSSGYRIAISVVTEREGRLTMGEITEVFDESKRLMQVFHCTKMSQSKYFAISTVDRQYIYGIVIQLDTNYGIAVGNNTVLYGSNYDAGKYDSVCAVDADHVFITYGPSLKLYGMLVTVSGTSITISAQKAIGTSYVNSSVYAKITKLNDTKLFIPFAGAPGTSSSYRLYGTVITISGTTFSVGSITELSNDAYSAYGLTACALSSSKAVVISQRSSSSLVAMVVTISGTSISKGSTYSIPDSGTTYTNCCRLSDSAVYLLYTRNVSGDSFRYYMYGVLLSVEGTVVNVGTSLRLGSYVGNKGVGDNIYLPIFTIPITDASHCCVFYGANPNSGATYLSGIVLNPWDISNGVKPFESRISGVAKTAGSGGSTVSVFVPGVTS